jgi:hypothetical protein
MSPGFGDVGKHKPNPNRFAKLKLAQNLVPFVPFGDQGK